MVFCAYFYQIYNEVVQYPDEALQKHRKILEHLVMILTEVNMDFKSTQFQELDLLYKSKTERREYVNQVKSLSLEHLLLYLQQKYSSMIGSFDEMFAAC